MIINRKSLFSYIRILFVICFAFMIYAVQAVYADNETVAGTDLYSDIDDYLRGCVEDGHIPSISVAIVNKDEMLFSQNYGDCKSGDTPFLLGSVSKSFTAVCIMQLVEQGKIDLNATLSTYLPDAYDGDRITVNQLLKHTSGLGEHQTLENYRIVNEQDVHNYANVNYSLLGEIIEAASGKSYSHYISENLFQPLQLSHTAATFEESIENGLIDGYANYWGLHVKTAHRYPFSKNAWITVPAGYLSSSTNDLGKYLQMYLNGGNGIISEQSVDTIFYGDQVYVDDDVPYWYGYGWTMQEAPFSEPVLRHSGLIETGTACVFILPERDIAIAIVTNVNDYFVTNPMVDRLGWNIVLMILGSRPDESGNYGYESHYWYGWKHFWINLILFVILVIAISPLCLLSGYWNRVKSRKRFSREVSLLLLHLLLPVFILLFVPIFFATPLWVARAFVPDIFMTVVISSVLLFIGGFLKSVILCWHRKQDK